MKRNAFKTILYLRTDIGTRELSSGGSVTHTLGVIDGFLKQGTTIYCASSAMHTLLHEKKGIIFKPLTMPRWCRWFGCKITSLLSNVRFVITTMWFMRNIPIDYIYQRYSMLCIVGVLMAKLKKKPLILEFNGSEVWVDMHWSPQKKISLTWLIAWFERYNVRHATRIIVVSAVLKDMLTQQGVDSAKIVVNPNGVDTDLFDPQCYAHRRHTIRAAYGMQDRYVFGFIGSFSYWHGVELLSALMPRLLAHKPQAHFFLIGTGPLLAQLKKGVQMHGIQDHVTFVGALPYAQAPVYLSACDAYLCPSQPNTDGTPFFGSPTKLFEYMSMGKPIIASDVDQLRDIIDTTIGFLVPPDDVNGFVKAAGELMERDQQEQQSMGDQARHRAVERHSWHHHVRAIEHCLP